PVVGGHRPYELGVVRGNVEIADLLLAAGADRTLDPVMAFAGACARADRAEVERLLGDDPALVQRAMRREPQLMVTAVEQRRRDAVRLLAEVGFDVNLMPRGAPLHEAAYMGDLELVELLLELGADPELRDRSYDSTPLGWAEYNGQEEVAEFLRRSSTSTRT